MRYKIQSYTLPIHHVVSFLLSSLPCSDHHLHSLLRFTGLFVHSFYHIRSDYLVSRATDADQRPQNDPNNGGSHRLFPPPLTPWPCFPLSLRAGASVVAPRTSDNGNPLHWLRRCLDKVPTSLAPWRRSGGCFADHQTLIFLAVA